jgi:hypothetical protein
MDYLDFIDLRVEEKVGPREDRRFRNALKLSGLSHHKASTSSISSGYDLTCRSVSAE